MLPSVMFDTYSGIRIDSRISQLFCWNQNQENQDINMLESEFKLESRVWGLELELEWYQWVP